MTMTDPLADMLTRIRNGQNARLSVVSSPYSKLRADVLEALKEEGYIRGYTQVANDNGAKPELKIELKYINGVPVIKELKRISKPGRRCYSQISSLEKYYNGLGVVILTTPKGVMSDYKARLNNVGGEVLFCVF